MPGALGLEIQEALRPLLDKVETLSKQVEDLQESLGTVPTDRLWDCDEVAKKLKVKRATIHTWTHRGLIQVVKQGRRSLVPDSELKRIIRNGGIP
jgi:excisionase family DNA binding protein